MNIKTDALFDLILPFLIMPSGSKNCPQRTVSWWC